VLHLVDARLLEALDRFEGHPDFYRRSEIALENGGAAGAYLLVRGIPGAHIIPSGSWRSRTSG
jgi:gamma-glutamylcyclotransferase (GGCT)/AIG2-like uncharacterized protein YtfP